MASRDGICHNVGCSNPTAGKKYLLCRPCAIGDVTGRHPFIEPCSRYVAEPVAHLQGFTCRNCGFDSAKHPGGGRVALSRVAIAW